MKLSSIIPGYFRTKYRKNPEAIANQYAIRGMTITIFIMALIWFLNYLNIFMVDHGIITRVFCATFVLYLIGLVIFYHLNLTQAWIKYFIILWVVSITTTMTTLLTFHASLVCLLPILYTAMYSSKKLPIYTYILSVISIIITVFVGYHYGLCDTNMVLLSGEPLVEYLDANGNFLLTKVNDQLLWSLSLFFVVPRSIICVLFTVICQSISKIIRNNMKYAHEMELLAEIDEMTGVYNRNKYLSMTSGGYEKEDKIAVIFWDINQLKYVNDTLGHKAGDTLIITIVNIIRQLTDQFTNVYRIGGDEFVMIIRGGDKEIVEKKIQKWNESLAKAHIPEHIPVSASVGYAYGSGKDLEAIIHAADEMMYQDKRKFHEVQPR